MESWKVVLFVLVALVVLYKLYGYFKKRAQQSAQSNSAEDPAESSAEAAPVQIPREPASPPPTDAEWREQLTAAEDIDQCLEVFNGVPDGSPVEDEAKAKLVTIVSAALAKLATIEEGWDLRNEIVNAELSWDETGAIATQALQKALGLVETYEEAKTFFTDLEDADEDDALKSAAVAKAIELADFGECIEFVGELDNYSGYEEQSGTIIDRALSLATTAEECEQLRSDLSLDDDLDQEVRTKMIALAESVEDCQTIWDDAGVDSHIGQLAICRAADVIREETRARAAALAAPAPTRASTTTE